MKGRQKGRPTKWLKASVEEAVWIGKRGIRFDVWHKWKKTSRKLGTLIVSVGGLRWRASNGKLSKRVNWQALSDWLDGES